MVDWRHFSRRDVLKTMSAAAALPTRNFVSDVQRDGPYVTTSTDRVRLGNTHLELVFRRDNGGIAQLRGKQPEFTLRTESRYPALTWGLRFYHPEYDNLMTASYMADTPTIKTDVTDTKAAVTLRWSNPPLKAPPHGHLGTRFTGTIEVTATLRRDDPDSTWNIRVTNAGDRAIKETICPQISSIGQLEDGADALYLPVRLGRKYPDPTHLGFTPTHRYPSGFGTMQWAAYLDDSGGLYTAATDTSGYQKQLEFAFRETGILAYRARHLVPYRPGEDVTVPYAMTVGVHSGDWQDACDRYRTWVESEGWLADASPTVPDRLRDRGLSYHERSYTRAPARSGAGASRIPFDQMERMVENVHDRLDVPMGFRWWGWATHGWPAAGDWVPPKEGLAAYRTVVKGLATTGVNTIGFLNPTFLLQGSDYWQGLPNEKRLPRTRRDGTPMTMENQYGMTFYHMEPTTPQWRTHYQQAIETLVESGVGEIDLDGFPWKWPSNCWNDAHDHPVGRGGNWFATRMRALLKDLHDRLDVDAGLVLGGEGIADYYLPYLNTHVTRDGMVELDDPAVRNGDAAVVPMFPYTFGDYAGTRTQKGHIGTFTEQRNLQRLFAGRAIAWGSIHMFMGHYEPLPAGYDEVLLDYYARIGQARTGYANRFLAHGDMLTRPPLDRRTVTISQRGVATTTEELRGHGWRAPTGDLGIVLTNVSNREASRRVSIDLETQPYALPADPLVYVVRNGRYRGVAETTVAVTAAPGDVVLIAAIPGEDSARQALAAIERAQADENTTTEAVQAAKRAFDAHRYEAAIDTARAALQDPPTTTQSNPTPSPTTTGQSPTSASTGTSAESPGFGVGPTLAGLAGSGALVRWLIDDEGADQE